MKIPKYSRHSSGQARVRLGGETFYLGPYGSKASKDKYNRLVGEYIANNGVVIREGAKADLTVTEMFLVYVNWAKEHYGAGATEFDKVKRLVRRTKAIYGKSTAAAFV